MVFLRVGVLGRCTVFIFNIMSYTVSLPIELVSSVGWGILIIPWVNKLLRKFMSENDINDT